MSYKEFIKDSLKKKSDPALRESNITRSLAAQRTDLQRNSDIVNSDTSNIIIDTSTSISTPSNVLISGSAIGASAIGGATNFSPGLNFSGSGRKK